MNLFITGTNTSIGKTIVSSILCLKLGWKYWKPIQSGMHEITDSNFLRKLIGKKNVYEEAYCFKNPLSPHLSSKIEGISIDLKVILEKRKKMNCTVIEGAGGLLVPINKNFFMIDLIKEFKVHPILVACSKLGTINHTLLSIEALRKRSIEPLGVVMVGEKNLFNKKSIEFYGGVKILGEIPPLSKVNLSTLIQAGNLIHLKGDQL